MAKTKVKKHYKNSKKGNRFKVKKHKRIIKPGKQRAIFRMMQLDPDLTKPQAEQTFRRIIDSFKEDVKKEKRIAIPDFGVFKRKAIPARKGGKKIQAFGKTFVSKSKPASVRIKFFPSKKFKKFVM